MEAISPSPSRTGAIAEGPESVTRARNASIAPPRWSCVITEADKVGARETVHRVPHRFRNWPLVPRNHQKLRGEVLDHSRVERPANHCQRGDHLGGFGWHP